MPLREALTCLPFWAILLSNMGNNWGFYTILTEMPLYMKDMLLQDIKSVSYTAYEVYISMLYIFSTYTLPHNVAFKLL